VRQKEPEYIEELQTL